MKFKVCGMKYPGNITELIKLPVDMIGFIFYEKSPRYAGDMDAEWLKEIPAHIEKTGVFVNETQENILSAAQKYGLDIIQLHGNESPGLCSRLKESGYKVVKAFSIAEAEDLCRCETYDAVCSYFLFDTKTPQYGGSGQKFDWELLKAYKGEKPFMLSGGVSPADGPLIQQLGLDKLYALDLNSKFETAPGLKDIQLLKQFLKTCTAK